MSEIKGHASKTPKFDFVIISEHSIKLLSSKIISSACMCYYLLVLYILVERPCRPRPAATRSQELNKHIVPVPP